MSNAKSLQSECSSYFFLKPKLKLQKDFVDLSSLTFGPLLPYNTHSNVCLFAPPPPRTLNHPRWTTRAPPESSDPAPEPTSPFPHPPTWTTTLWSDNGMVGVCVCGGGGIGSVEIYLVERGWFRWGRVGIGSEGGWRVYGYKKGQWCKPWREQKRAIVERNKIQLLSNIKKKQNYHFF